MARGVNQVILIGNLGQDPVYRVSKFGGIVTGSLATTDRVQDNDNQWEDRVEWHSLVFKRQQADFVRDYAAKGSQLYIEGQNRTRKWPDRNHPQIKHQRTEIVVTKVELLSSPSTRSPGGGQHETPQPHQHAHGS